MKWLIPRFGISYVGLFFLLLLFTPNFLWMKKQPQEYTSAEESGVLVILERTGQVLVTTMSLCFADLNLRPWTLWSWWLVVAILLIALYEGFWLRYFRNGHTLEDFYGSFCGFPVAGATLPVLSFFCLSIYAKNLWLLLAVLILGVGHIGIHLQHRSTFLLEDRENNS